MEVYRITQEKFATDLSGNGARLYGGRWNSEGIHALYTASNRSLALLETLAHSSIKLLTEKNYILVTISIPEEATIKVITTGQLDEGWDKLLANHITIQTGDNFLISNKHLLLQVPSVLVPEESNIVINPLHPLMDQVYIKDMREININNRLINNM